jgi:hypothetical protein
LITAFTSASGGRWLGSISIAYCSRRTHALYPLPCGKICDCSNDKPNENIFMTLNQRIEKEWEYWEHTKHDVHGEKPCNKYKLHTNIGNFYDEKNSALKDKINKFLNQAVTEGIIPCYKIYRYPPENQNIKIHPYDNRYIKALPYTLYLYDEFSDNDFSAIARLCENIESISTGSPCGDEKWMCQSDIFLSKHITFRQAMLSDYYIASLTKEAITSKKFGEKSAHYRYLRACFVNLSTENRSGFFHSKRNSLAKQKVFYQVATDTFQCLVM